VLQVSRTTTGEDFEVALSSDLAMPTTAELRAKKGNFARFRGKKQ
jgi:hypothetical protein